MSATPAELLAAWRAAERRYAKVASGLPRGQRAARRMRRLMDEYDWAVRGRVGWRPEGPARRREAQDGPGG